MKTKLLLYTVLLTLTHCSKCKNDPTPAGPLADSSLAPNPAHATATVQMPAVPGASAATLTLRDALGRAVRAATVALPATGPRHTLDLAGLPAGLYALQVQVGAARATHRLVVE